MQGNVSNLFHTTIDLALKLHSEGWETIARTLKITIEPLNINMLKAVTADNSVLVFQVRMFCCTGITHRAGLGAGGAGARACHCAAAANITQ